MQRIYVKTLRAAFFGVSWILSQRVKYTNKIIDPLSVFSLAPLLRLGFAAAARDAVFIRSKWQQAQDDRI